MSRVGVEVFKPHSAKGKDIAGLDALGHASDIPSSAADEKCLKFRESCLQRCEEEHCCTWGFSFLPTRVLKIEHVQRPGPGGDQVFVVRLYTEEEQAADHASGVGDDEDGNNDEEDDERNTENEDEMRRRRRKSYTALSYRWPEGDEEKTWLKTTRENNSAFQGGIPWTAMPEVFQDAVKVTHRLGLQYMWVDSLCIIQGDEDDWKTEAQKMGDVYSRAFVTIAAASSSSGSWSFLKRRPAIHDALPVKWYGPRKPSSAGNWQQKLALRGPTRSLPRWCHGRRLRSRQ